MGNLIKAVAGFLPPWVWLIAAAGAVTLFAGVIGQQRYMAKVKERDAFNEFVVRGNRSREAVTDENNRATLADEREALQKIQGAMAEWPEQKSSQ